MKKVAVLLGALVAILFTGMAAQGQNLKFAHIDTQALIASMPERDSAMTKLKAFEQDLMEQMDQLQVEVNKKYQDYLQKRDGFTPSVRESKEKELTELQQRLQEFQSAAQRDFNDMQSKLMQPIIERAHAAIEKVGKAGGYIYVLDKSLGSILYNSDQSVDLLPEVQKELGIKAKAEKVEKTEEKKK